MLTLLVAFSLGGSLGFLAGCLWKAWLDSQSLNETATASRSNAGISSAQL